MNKFLDWIPLQWRLAFFVIALVAYTAWFGSGFTHDLQAQTEAIYRDIRRVERNIDRLSLDYWSCSAEKDINFKQRLAICQSNPKSCEPEVWPRISCPALPSLETPAN